MMVTPGILDLAGLDRAPLDLVVLADDEDIIAARIAHHRALRQDRGGGLRRR